MDDKRRIEMLTEVVKITITALAHISDDSEDAGAVFDTAIAALSDAEEIEQEYQND